MKKIKTLTDDIQISGYKILPDGTYEPNAPEITILFSDFVKLLNNLQEKVEKLEKLRKRIDTHAKIISKNTGGIGEINRNALSRQEFTNWKEKVSKELRSITSN